MCVLSETFEKTEGTWKGAFGVLSWCVRGASVVRSGPFFRMSHTKRPGSTEKTGDAPQMHHECTTNRRKRPAGPPAVPPGGFSRRRREKMPKMQVSLETFEKKVGAQGVLFGCFWGAFGVLLGCFWGAFPFLVPQPFSTQNL